MTVEHRRLKGVCIGAGYFSHYHYDAWQRIPDGPDSRKVVSPEKRGCCFG